MKKESLSFKESSKIILRIVKKCAFLVAPMIAVLCWAVVVLYLIDGKSDPDIVDVNYSIRIFRAFLVPAVLFTVIWIFRIFTKFFQKRRER